MPETTFIEEEGIHVCNNCGAYARNVDDILHYKTCKLYESNAWEKLYNQIRDGEVTIK